MSSTSNGILYLVWGNYNADELNRSIRSVEGMGYDYYVAEIPDQRIHLAHKPQMYDLSPFCNTLFLDTDTQMMEPVDFGFKMCERWGLCIAHAPASSGHLAAKAIGMPVDYDLPQYNTGVIFFSRKVKRLFIFWDELCKHYPKSSTNDQPAMSQALHDWGEPYYVLNRLWNYRAKMRYEAKVNFGRVKILHQR